MRIQWTHGRAALGVVIGLAGLANRDDGAFPVEPNLKAGVAKTHITPPDDLKITGHLRPTSGSRDPIRTGVLLLDDGKTTAAIVTFDLIGVGEPFGKGRARGDQLEDRHHAREHFSHCGAQPFSP